jgi:signal transduction histidine kinase
MKIRRKRQDRTAVGRTPSAKGPTVREAALAARVTDLEAELRARDDLLAIAAHELRNPMTPISARLELLLAKACHMSGDDPAELVHGLELLEGLVNAYSKAGDDPTRGGPRQFRETEPANRRGRPLGADPAGHGEHASVGGERRLPSSTRR